MRTWTIVLLFFVGYVLQTSLFDRVALWGVRPDIVMILVCIVALRRGPREGAISGAIAGFFVDLSGGRLIGLGAMAKAAAGACVGWAGARVFGENALVTVGMVAVASVMEQVIYLFGAWAFGFPFPLQESVVRVALPSLWYDSAASVVVYPLFLLLERWIGNLSSSDRPGPIHG